MTDEERATVEIWYETFREGATPRWHESLLRYVIVLSLAFVAANLTNLAALVLLGRHTIWGYLPGVVLVIALAWIRLRRESVEANPQVVAYGQALADGQVTVQHYTVDAVVLVQGVDENGASFPDTWFLQVTPTRILVLDDMEIAEEDAVRFPNTDVAVIRLPATSDILRVAVNGAYLAPTRVRGPFNTVEQAPDSGELLEGSLEELDTLLCKNELS